MRRTTLVFVGLLTIGLLCAHLQFRAEAQPPAQETGVKRALLIGINKYKAVPKLQGSLNDIATMKQILITRWGFDERHITLLTDEAATRAGMLAAMEQFVREAGADDTVYFHYSGHGSQVEDTNGDEKDDGLDETLVPQDGRSGDVRDITDDELDALFARLRSKTALIVLDSCHSGTATRSLAIRTRSIPPDTRVDLYRKAEASVPKTRAVVPVVSSRYVVMTGAASHQEALDGPVEGRYHGFFTYALSKSLSSSPADASPHEVFRGVERELKRIQNHFGRTSMPEPQLEAPPELLDKSLLAPTPGALGADGLSSRVAWLGVKAAKPGMLTLLNGSLLGATPGSLWGVYPPGETKFAPGHALAVATVVQATGKDALAKVHAAGAAIPDGARAIALMPAPTGGKIAVHVLHAQKDKRKQIEEMLAKHVPNVELVGPEQSPRFLIDAQGNSVRLLTADGLQVVGTFAADSDWAATFASVMTRSAYVSELLTLDNPSSQLKVDVRVANVAQARPTTTRGIAVVTGDIKAGQYRIRRPGQARTAGNSLQLEIRANADSYVTIVDVDSEGGINVLFPNNYQQQSFHPDGRIPGGETVLIPDSIEAGNRAGFYWDYSPPKGTDTIRVFSSTDLETAQMIRERVRVLQAASSQTRGGVATRAVSSEVGALRTSLAMVAARGIVTVYDPLSHVPTQEAALSSNPAEFPVDSIQTEATQAAGSSSANALQNSVPADWSATSVTIVVSD
jgi:hypothetical protein